jgi:probable F420-dependent oxidoreductase
MVDAAVLDEVARCAEERSFGCLWVGEHVVLFDEYESAYPYAEDGKIPVPPGTGLLEPLTALTWVAAQTTTLRLGTAMLLLPQRNPVYTAKELATLDFLSGGRVDVGIGVGWLAEEMEACDVPFAGRGARCDAYVDVLKTLWCDEISSHHSDFYDLKPCRMDPKPVQHSMPLHIGGESDAALRRVARLGDGWHSFDRSPAELASGLIELDRHLEAAGRTRDEVTITVCPYTKPLDASTVTAYAEAGADAVAALFLALEPSAVEAAFDDLEACREAAARC